MGLFKWLLRLLITAAFILGGAVKLMPTINEEAYHQLDKAFSQFFDILPFDRFGYPTNHEQFLQVTGIIEITCGTLMFIGPAFLRAISSFVLIAIVSTVMYCMHALHHPQEHLVPAGACLGLLMLERIFSDG